VTTDPVITDHGAGAGATPSPPVPAPRPEITTVRHGVTLSDEFDWLRDPHWQRVLRGETGLDAAIRSHLDAENAYAEAMLADTVALQADLITEMRGRIREDDATVPAEDGPFGYFSRWRAGGEHRSVCRERRGGGACEVLLDGDALAAGKAYFRFGRTVHAPDHRLLAWSADDSGAEMYAIRVRDLAVRADLCDVVERTTGEVVWTRDGTAFYYVRQDDNYRPSSVLRHRLGTPASDDAWVFAVPDGSRAVSLAITRSGRFAVLSVADHDSEQALIVDLEDPLAGAVEVTPHARGLRCEVEHHPDVGGGSALFIRTNADGAEDFKIVWTPLANTARMQWREVVPHRPGVLILEVTVRRDWLIRLELSEGVPRIVYRRIGSGDERTVAFQEDTHWLDLHAGYEFATDILRFSYQSMTTPSEVWDYDLATGARRLRKRDEIPSGHDPADYVTARVTAPAKDGETVPVSVLRRRTTPLDGTAPLLVHGYGAYGVPMVARFNADVLSLVDRGFVYAIAHVRGGTEKGWRWYREGKLANKPNTFTDFVAATEYLVTAGFGAPGKVAAYGISAGGLLIGAVANLRPGLYAALVANVPFVDALNTMLDDTLPLTPPEWLEWGNPVTDPEAFAAMRAYAPYDNVRARHYPAILALAGLNDPRVTYWEPAKWVARLRARKTGRNPVLLRTDMDKGHGRAPGRFERLKEEALIFAFIIAAVGRSLPGM
jgi:oligopeptidase B